MPRVQQPDAHPGPARAPYRPAQPSYDGGAYDDDAYDGGGRRGGRSRVPLIAAIGVGIAVLGVGAGALLSTGSGKDQGEDGETVAASSPATQDSASPTVDPAREQAVELDKLLADSGSSRASVIQAVADVKQCDNLDQAAADLRDAAEQRNQLVTRLGKLSVDKLPGHADLTAALTKAWQASAAADNHYAAWADQAKSRKVCRKGARPHHRGDPGRQPAERHRQRAEDEGGGAVERDREEVRPHPAAAHPSSDRPSADGPRTPGSVRARPRAPGWRSCRRSRCCRRCPCRPRPACRPAPPGG